MATEVKKRYDWVDLMKFICAIMVVAIHTILISETEHVVTFEIAQVIGRTAVPFFFMCSGFFFTQKLLLEQKGKSGALGSVIKRLLFLYIGWSAIYLAYDFRICLKMTSGFWPALMLYLRNLIFLGGHFHLWYLPALMLAMTLLYISIRLKRFTLFLWMAGMLYLVGLAGNTYNGLIHEGTWLYTVYDSYFSFFVTTRNGLFFGFFYVMLGGLASYCQGSVHFRTGLWLAVVFMGLLHLEAYSLERYAIPKAYDMYLMTAPYTYFLFHALLGISLQIKEGFVVFFRRCSMGVYFIHGLFLLFYEKVFLWSGMALVGSVYFILVAVSSILAVWILSRVRSTLVQSLICEKTVVK